MNLRPLGYLSTVSSRYLEIPENASSLALFDTSTRRSGPTSNARILYLYGLNTDLGNQPFAPRARGSASGEGAREGCGISESVGTVDHLSVRSARLISGKSSTQISPGAICPHRSTCRSTSGGNCRSAAKPASATVTGRRVRTSTTSGCCAQVGSAAHSSRARGSEGSPASTTVPLVGTVPGSTVFNFLPHTLVQDQCSGA